MEYSKIHSELTKLLKNVSKSIFGEEIVPTSIDAFGDLTRPMVKLGISESKIRQISGGMLEKELSFVVILFIEKQRLKGSNETSIFYKFQEDMARLFLPMINIDNIFFPITEISFSRNLNENAVIAEFKLVDTMLITDDCEETMSELNVDKGVI